MTRMTRLSLAGTTALVAMGGMAAAQSVTIGITQNNVGVDSYQTTYERAFIAAAEANPRCGCRRARRRRRCRAPDPRRSRTSCSKASTR